MSTALRFGVVGAVPDPAPRLLEELGCTLTALEPALALAALRSAEVAGVALSAALPAKLAALISRLDPIAAEADFVDTLVRAGDALVGHATLAEGLVAAVQARSWGLADRPALLLGAGGRARSIAAALLLEGSLHVRFATRSIGQAIRAIDQLRPLARRQGALLDLVPLESMPWEDDWERGLLIHATPIGLDSEDADPLWRFARLGREMRVVDLVHRPVRTALMRRAHRSKGEYLTGMEVQAEQALRRFSLASGAPVEPALATRIRHTP